MAKTRVLGVTVIALLTACQVPGEDAANQEPELEYLTAPGEPSTLPFSEAVRMGNTLYLSGRIGSVPGQGLPEGGIQPETRQTLENIKAVLGRHGSSMDRVMKCTVMLADISEWGAMNEVYAEFFPTNKPARSAFGTSGLAAGARVEIECMAAVG